MREAPTFTEHGWTGLPDDRPTWPWKVHVECRDIGIDEAEPKIAVAFAVICLVGALASSVTDPSRPEANIGQGLIGVCALVGAAVYVVVKRHPRSVTLTLDDDRLQVSGADHQTGPVELLRDDADSLVAHRAGLAETRRTIYLFNREGRLIARITAGVATVVGSEWVDAGPEPPPFPSRLPVSVLVGSWWPHPARRTLVLDRIGRPVVWREPDVHGYAAWERRYRLRAGLITAAAFGAAALAVQTITPADQPAWVLICAVGAAMGLAFAALGFRSRA